MRREKDDRADLLDTYEEDRRHSIHRWCVIEDAARNPIVIHSKSWGETTFEDERVRNRGILT